MVLRFTTRLSYLSLPPTLLFLSTPANPAMLTSTSTTAPTALPPLPPASPLRPSNGPCTEHIMAVFPIDRYDEPELAGFVEIWAWSSRSSFHRRPSSRNLVRGYVVDVSRGIMTEQNATRCTARCCRCSPNTFESVRARITHAACHKLRLSDLVDLVVKGREIRRSSIQDMRQLEVCEAGLATLTWAKSRESLILSILSLLIGPHLSFR